MTENANAFLDAFVAIEQELRKHTKAKPAEAFSRLVDLATSTWPVVRQYESDLKQLADLRNAIVHTRSQDNKVLAEPLDSTVGLIQRIRERILQPPTVGPTFQRAVFTVRPDDSVAKVVSVMSDKSVSQLPVVQDARIVDVLSAQTIARWLGAKVPDDILSLGDSTVSGALPFKEPDEIFEVVGRSTTLAECLDLFHKHEDAGKTLAAVLITESGKVTQTLLGIVTTYDFPIILKALRP